MAPDDPEKNLGDDHPTRIMERNAHNDGRIIVLEDVGRAGCFRVTMGFVDGFGGDQSYRHPLDSSHRRCLHRAHRRSSSVAECHSPTSSFRASTRSSKALASATAQQRLLGFPMVSVLTYGWRSRCPLSHIDRSYSSPVPDWWRHLTSHDARDADRAIEDPDPVLFLEHKKCYRLIKGEVPDELQRSSSGRPRLGVQGTSVHLLWSDAISVSRRQSGLPRTGSGVESISWHLAPWTGIRLGVGG